MRHAGTILAEVLRQLEAALQPGITTAELDAIAERIIRDAGAVPSFLGYGGARGQIPFPGSICASINDEVVHGIPSARRRIEAGDVVGLDVGCIWQGWHADTARTFAVGPVPAPVVDADRRHAAGDAGRDRGGAAGEPARRCRRRHRGGRARAWLRHRATVRRARHRHRHARGSAGAELRAGRGPGCGSRRGCASRSSRCSTWAATTSAVLDDGWTVVTADGSLSAHFEDTIAVTPSGPEVLTRA